MKTNAEEYERDRQRALFEVHTVLKSSTAPLMRTQRLNAETLVKQYKISALDLIEYAHKQARLAR